MMSALRRWIADVFDMRAVGAMIAADERAALLNPRADLPRV